MIELIYSTKNGTTEIKIAIGEYLNTDSIKFKERKKQIYSINMATFILVEVLGYEPINFTHNPILYESEKKKK